MPYTPRIASLALTIALAAAAGCSKAQPAPDNAPVYDLAGGCYAVGLANGPFLTAQDGVFAFAAERPEAAAAFRLQPSDLGHYLMYDADRTYFAAKRATDETPAPWRLRRTGKKADVEIPHHQAFSDAEWAFETPPGASSPYLLRHLRSGLYLGRDRLVGAGVGAPLRVVPREACVDYPELALDAKGAVRSEPWPDGSVYGVADAHSHLMTNLGFGGGGIFHGAPFHRLGVEHALEDCDEVHGDGGRRDIVGFFLGGSQEVDVGKVTQIIADGAVSEFNHATAGYPVFASWPDPRDNPTHQQQYYRWLERAYLGGLRLIFQHATGNSALCEFLVGLGSQEAPYSCNDMVSVDRTIEQTRALERYVDARAGGPGRGWLRIVTSPAQAREVIAAGKLAVVLGIEISNVFDCFLTPPPGMPACTPEHVRAQVQAYHKKGVRVVFPVHKYDNGFSPGDGHRGVIEIGNLMNSGHYSNYTLDCPDIQSFDRGNVVFGGLNRPRADYFSAPPLDVSKLSEKPLQTLLPVVPELTEPELVGAYCQAAGLTELGRLLLDELMARGMLIDIAHLPQWSTVEALEILDKNKYPAISTHHQDYDGQVYRHGGVSAAGFGRCGDPAKPGQLGAWYLAKAKEVEDANGLPAQPLAFDLNGFAGSRGPRFGPDGCDTPQVNPVTYPFKSFDGGVTFTRPTLGERVVDFNTEGMLHIGLLPELIEDVRRDGTTDKALEPLFKTAESLLRVWEAAEAAAK